MALDITITRGMKLGDLTVLRKLPPLKPKMIRVNGKRVRQKISPGLKKRWRVRCECGNELSIPEMYLRREPNPKRSCGKCKRTLSAQFNREYRIWIMMHERTENPGHVAYHRYGGRGIKVCPEWHRGDVINETNRDNFAKFLDHVGPAPGPEYSIDRIDNDGNYEPGNVRWATAKEQAINRSTTLESTKQEYES